MASSNQMFENWSRKEKEEYANKRMEEMKIRNQQIMKRHEIPAENTKEKSSHHVEKRIEREWDEGKTSKGFSEKLPKKLTEHKREGFYGSKLENWNDRNMHSHNYKRRSNDFDLNEGKSHNKSNFHRSYSHKSGSSVNRNDSKREFSYHSSKTGKILSKESDKVWRDDINELHNKQTRVENWVESVSCEIGTESDDENSNSKNQRYKKFDKERENSTHGYTVKKRYEENDHHSRASDSSHQEDIRYIQSDRSKHKYKKNNYTKFQGDEYSSNAKGFNQNKDSSDKYYKPKVSNRYRAPENYKKREFTDKRSQGYSTKYSCDDRSFKHNHIEENNELVTSSSYAHKQNISNYRYPKYDNSNKKNKLFENSYEAVPKTAEGEAATGGTWSDQEVDYKSGRGNYSWGENKPPEKKEPDPWDLDENHIVNRLKRRAYGPNWKPKGFRNKEEDIQIEENSVDEDIQIIKIVPAPKKSGSHVQEKTERKKEQCQAQKSDTQNYEVEECEMEDNKIQEIQRSEVQECSVRNYKSSLCDDEKSIISLYATSDDFSKDFNDESIDIMRSEVGKTSPLQCTILESTPIEKGRLKAKDCEQSENSVLTENLKDNDSNSVEPVEHFNAISKVSSSCPDILDIAVLSDQNMMNNFDKVKFEQNNQVIDVENNIQIDKMSSSAVNAEPRSSSIELEHALTDEGDWSTITDSDSEEVANFKN